MKKIITLESIKGVGISTQCRLLKRYYHDSFGIEANINIFNNSIESELNNIKKTIEYFNKDIKIVINDGCFVKLVSYDIVNAVHQDKIYEKYKDILQQYEVLFHKYEMINLLLIPNNIKMGYDNLLRKSTIIDMDIPEFNQLKESKIIQALKLLDNYTMFQNIKFYSLHIHEDESILDVHKKIVDKLNNI